MEGARLLAEMPYTHEQLLSTGDFIVLDHSYEDILQSGLVPVWRDLDPTRNIYRTGHNILIRQLLERVSFRMKKGENYGKLRTHQVYIKDGCVILINHNQVLTGMGNYYPMRTKSLIKRIFKNEEKPNSNEYVDFMKQVDNICDRESIIKIYHHVFLHTDSERFAFPIIALSKLRYRKHVVDRSTSRRYGWISEYNKYVGNMAAGRVVNIQQIVNEAESDGIPLDAIYMKDGNPDYSDTHTEELRFYRNSLVHLDNLGFSQKEVSDILGYYFPHTVLELYHFMIKYSFDVDVVGQKWNVGGLI